MTICAIGKYKASKLFMKYVVRSKVVLKGKQSEFIHLFIFIRNNQLA